MNTFATIIVANKNRAAAKSLIGDDFFDIEAKKGLRKYWVGSGYFKTKEYMRGAHLRAGMCMINIFISLYVFERMKNL